MYAATVFLPLIGAIIAGLFGRLIGDKAAGWVCSGALLLSALLSVPMFIEVALLDNPRDVELLTWIYSGTFWRRTPLRLRNVKTMAPIMATSSTSPADWKK